MKKKLQRTDGVGGYIKGLVTGLIRDGWSSALTGIGDVNFDSRLSSQYARTWIDYDAARALWGGDDISARIVEIFPEEALREGFGVVVSGDLERSMLVQTAMEDIGADGAIFEAACFARAFGGGAILLGVDDGGKLEDPVDEKRVKGLKWVTVVEPRELTVENYYTDPQKPKFGKPAFYKINVIQSSGASFKPAELNSSMGVMIHESRVIALTGPKTSRNDPSVTSYGWGDSCLSRIVPVARDFANAWSATSTMINDFSQPIFKMSGLADLLGAGEDGEKVFKARVKAAQMSRSVVRALFIDQQDDFERKSTSVAGLPELLDRLCLRLSAATGIPVTLLMGQAPSGLNATGDADIRYFYDKVRAYQRKTIKPALTRIAKLMFAGMGGEPDKWSIEFNPLWQQSDLEKAQARNVQADTDTKYIAAGVLSANECAISRFGGDKYSFDTTIDVESRPTGPGDNLTEEDPNDGRGKPPSEITSAPNAGDVEADSPDVRATERP